MFIELTDMTYLVSFSSYLHILYIGRQCCPYDDKRLNKWTTYVPTKLAKHTWQFEHAAYHQRVTRYSFQPLQIIKSYFLVHKRTASTVHVRDFAFLTLLVCNKSIILHRLSFLYSPISALYLSNFSNFFSLRNVFGHKNGSGISQGAFIRMSISDSCLLCGEAAGERALYFIFRPLRYQSFYSGLMFSIHDWITAIVRNELWPFTTALPVERRPTFARLLGNMLSSCFLGIGWWLLPYLLFKSFFPPSSFGFSRLFSRL